jgi:enoyl-CoA hydratase/carnithine racemase
LSGAFVAGDDGAVRVLTLTHPPGNTLGLSTLKSLREEVLRAADDPRVRALALASGLPRYFSSGLDMEEILAQPEPRRGDTFEALLAAYRALLETPKPVVAALNGTAILGGWVLAMACDWRVMAAESGKVALSEVRLGLTPTPALVTRLSALVVDPGVVKEMVLRGKTLRAEEALAVGLVDELLPEAEVLGRSLALAKRLTKSAPTAFAALKRGLNRPFLDDALWQRSLTEFRTLLAGPEAREGMEAMRAKRRPRWEDA